MCLFCVAFCRTLTYSQTPLTYDGSRPFKSFVQSFDSWYSDKKACRPLHRIHSQHKPPGSIHPPILHIGILDSLRNRSRDQINDLYYHRVPVPFWDRHPGSGPHPPHPTKVYLAGEVRLPRAPSIPRSRWPGSLPKP